ncbi:MAG TPA: hypothetical protein PLD33_18655, partial [Anaerolineales bacterium]|nr:hypothetical protein [Anaerolineales bacterium]HNC91412.1 hypothetical protein [Anaerolineales bacterium]HNH80673.1 hypothetical protein [Anaerolineales bacterium]
PSTFNLQPSTFIMTLPTILFALVVALLLGAMYHFFRGGGGWRLMLFFGLSILGFALGQLLAMWQGWRILMFGSLDLGMGGVGSLLMLVTGEWLSRIDVKEIKKESGV